MNLFYRTVGEGTPIFILHGLYGASDNWMQIAKILSANYQVISIDHRNHGSSPHDNSHNYDDLVSDLAWLFHETDIEKAHILGHSMGGKVAIAFAADYPEKILSLTVADIAPRNYLETPASAIQYDFHKRILNTLSELKLSEYRTRKDVDLVLKKTIPEQLVRQFILKNLHRSKSIFEWKINVPVLKAHLNHIISGVDYREYEDRIPILLYPVLFIKGELSGYIQKEDEKIIKTMYPEARIVTISEASHFLHAEKPKEFTSIFESFLKTIH